MDLLDATKDQTYEKDLAQRVRAVVSGSYRPLLGIPLTNWKGGLAMDFPLVDLMDK
jgi:hypothetical protein